jgi:uncharacterized surface protein with fasciclin (FAS1) repeats
VASASDSSTLFVLVVLAGLDGAVPEEFISVALNNDEFAELPAEVVDFLTSNDGKETLCQILLYHIFPGIFVSSELSNGLTVQAVTGGTVTVSVSGVGVFFNLSRL